ncbi:MAG: purine/pyrimidine permease [Bacillota bacterium]|nr:purine/pyrimidine permease [Bacillota bacterium]
MTNGSNKFSSARNIFIYALQWLCVNLVLCIVLPLVIGPYLGLDQEGLRQLTQRTFFYTGLATILQIYLGHKLPIYEGPSTIWVSAIIALSGNALLSGKPLTQLQGELALGFIIGGILYIVLASFKLMNRISKLFTPAVMGTFFVLIVFQIGKSVASNFIRFPNYIISVNWINITLASITIITIFLSNKYGKLYLRNFSLLAGAIAGWLAHLVIAAAGLIPYRLASASGLPAIEFPSVLAWGMPKFDLVVVITSLIIAFMVFANVIATVKGMADLTGAKEPDMDRAVMITGTANIIGGLGGTIGFVPQSHCIGFVEVTGNPSKNPLVLHAVILMLMGLLPAMGAFFASMPPAVGQAILMVVLAKMFGLGLAHYSKVTVSRKRLPVISIPLVIGIGLIFLPAHFFSSLPVMISGIAGNGLVVGLIVSLLLDNIL